MIQWQARKLARRTVTEAVVLHHTEGGPGSTVEGLDRIHLARGWQGIGYHLLVRDDPRRGWLLAYGRPLDAAGAHAALGEDEAPTPGRTRGWWNHRAVGLAIAGSYLRTNPPEPALLIAMMAIVDLRSRYGPLRILSHREAMAELGAPGHTDCPGLGGWVDWIRDRLPADGPA